MLSNQDILNIRKNFPILNKKIYGNNWIYLDNAATTQKPIKVINSIIEYYYNFNANVHRGDHYISQLATIKMENSRKKIQKFINASSSSEIIFTKNTTEAINLVATSIQNQITKNDEIIISNIEHHSNIVPWQNLCEKTGAVLKIIKIDKKYLNINLNTFQSLLSKKTKILSICHISNVLGSINPIKEIINQAHKYNILVLIDGAQVPSHDFIDVQSLNADFYTFSLHKMYGPTGVGILYGKKNILNNLNPYQFGGEMIKEVTLKKTTYSNLPFKFEAGTPNIEGIIASIEAINFIKEIGINNIKLYEKELCNYTIKMLKKIDDIIIYNINNIFSSIISFNIKNIHPFDVGSILNKLGIAVRTGHHCAQPLMKYLNIPGTIRISFGIYNTFKEIDKLYHKLLIVKKILKN